MKSEEILFLANKVQYIFRIKNANDLWKFIQLDIGFKKE